MRRALERSRGTHFRQRGNSLVVALIALTGLGTLGALTASSVQGGLTSVTAERGHAIALLAAEAGAAAGVDFLRNLSYSQYNWFTSNIRVNNVNAETPPAIRGNERMPGASGNPFSPDMKAWYRVTIFNNEQDPNFDGSRSPPPNNLPLDSDGRVILESIGYGPNRATATIRVEVQGLPQPTLTWVSPPPPLPVGLPDPVLTPSPAPQFLTGIAVLSWREVQ